MSPDLPPSAEIDAARALELHRIVQRDHKLLIWVVLTGTEEYGDRFVARPWLTYLDATRPFLHHLLADDLEALRAKLPPGLVRVPHQPSEDPVIIETWL